MAVVGASAKAATPASCDTSQSDDLPPLTMESFVGTLLRVAKVKYGRLGTSMADTTLTANDASPLLRTASTARVSAIALRFSGASIDTTARPLHEAFALLLDDHVLAPDHAVHGPATYNARRLCTTAADEFFAANPCFGKYFSLLASGAISTPVEGMHVAAYPDFVGSLRDLGILAGNFLSEFDARLAFLWSLPTGGSTSLEYQNFLAALCRVADIRYERKRCELRRHSKFYEAADMLDMPKPPIHTTMAPLLDRFRESVAAHEHELRAREEAIRESVAAHEHEQRVRELEAERERKIRGAAEARERDERDRKMKKDEGRRRSIMKKQQREQERKDAIVRRREELRKQKLATAKRVAVAAAKKRRKKLLEGPKKKQNLDLSSSSGDDKPY